MESQRSATGVFTILAPAKLNLYFEVLAKRPDGFHEIETLMASIDLCDELRFGSRPDVAASASPLSLKCRWAESVARKGGGLRGGFDGSSAWELPSEQHNLAYRALTLFRAEAGVTAGADVELIKRIPLAAGLAGGSSDAAAALLAANIVWRTEWPLQRLAELAARLGSDVPFFLHVLAGRPGLAARSNVAARHGGAAVCRGRGERIELVGRLPAAWLVVVKPPAGLATADVYRHCRPIPPGELAAGRTERLAAALRGGNRRAARGLLGNRLEEAAERLSPWPARLRAAFARSDCAAAQMSGSGTSYFGFCRHARQARRVARQLAARRLGSVWAVRS